MVITDGVHLVSSSNLSELHSFANRIGLKREWFQDHPRHPHYDLTTKRMYKKAVEAGAKVVSPQQLVQENCGNKFKKGDQVLLRGPVQVKAEVLSVSLHNKVALVRIHKGFREEDDLDGLTEVGLEDLLHT